uniref:Cystatin domain-containing protein n=1 Tax=Astatotilapia calliptera TaxID=8154 RepID=A0AAX7SHG6_ASTCA
MFAWFFVFVFVCVCASAAEQTMTGEPRRVPVNDTRVLTAAHFAVAEFNKVNAGEMFAYKTVAITSAKIQVVAGIKYILDMLLGQTVCSRNHALYCASSLSVCPGSCKDLVACQAWSDTWLLN